jgi:hypothetical protein
MVITDTETPTEQYSMSAYPLLRVDRDLSIVIDARQGQRLRFTTPQPAEVAAVNIGFDGRTAWGVYGWHFTHPSDTGITTRHLGQAAPKTAFIGRVEAAILAQPDGSRGIAGTPYRYNLAWYTPGVLPTGFNGTVRPGDLAAVHETYLAQSSGLVAQKYTAAFPR